MEDVARLMDGEDVDLIWTDPPYHVGKKFGEYDEGLRWDGGFQNAWLDVVKTLAPEAQRYICFAQAQSMNAINTFLPRRILIWCKPFALMRANEWDWAYEFIAWCYDTDKPNYFDKPEGTLSFDWQEIRSAIHGQDGKYHLTQKPKELPELHVRASCPDGGTVFDPFLGSGTTMVAAEQLNRICYGMEIHPPYVAVCLERMSGMGLIPKLKSGTQPEGD
jgi:DNA modification methylase